MLYEIERRASPGAPTTTDEHAILGYASVFSSLSQDLGGFRERVLPGAFDKSLRDRIDVVARAHHDSAYHLGRVSTGRLKLSVDSRGLRYECQVPNTQAGRDVWELVQLGEIKESSFAFYVDREGQRWLPRGEDGLPIRELVNVVLVDVAPVVSGAYSSTVVGARTLAMAKAAATGRPFDPGNAPTVNGVPMRPTTVDGVTMWTNRARLALARCR